MNGSLFNEKQYMRQWWIWAPVVLATFGVMSAQGRSAYRYFVMGIPTGHHPGPDWLLALVVAVTSLLLMAIPVLLWFMHLWVEVRADGLHVQFRPFQKRLIPYSEITSYEVRTYRPIRDYGGWGIRYSWFHGMAYNVRGNRGVQLVLSNGKRVLIGSQRPEELASAIRSAKTSYEGPMIR